jgi:hypothetical protein
MATRRTGLIVLLTAALTLTAGALLRPTPARAAASKQRQYVFGPVFTKAGGSLVYFNAGTKTIPGATIISRDVLTGTIFHNTTIAETTPNTARSIDHASAEPVVMVTVVTFNAPAAGQALPAPFAANLLVTGQGGEEVVVGPGH